MTHHVTPRTKGAEQSAEGPTPAGLFALAERELLSPQELDDAELTPREEGGQSDEDGGAWSPEARPFASSAHALV